MNKKVPIFKCLAFGFREFWKHLPVLLPLGSLFFAPEFSDMAGWHWPEWSRQLYKAAVFFVMLFSALNMTRGAREKIRGRASQGQSFAGAELIKWSLMGLSAIGAVALLALLVAALSPQWMSSQIGVDGWSTLPGLLRSWWLNQPWFLRVVSLLLFVWLPLRAHVALNFFGFLIVDRGLGAMPAIRASIALTRGAFWDLALLYTLCGMLDAMGLLAYVIGAAFTFPITLLATIYAYRSLVDQGEAG